MKKKILLDIKSTQTADFKSDKIEIKTYGDFYKKGDNYYISYKDSPATGLENHTTMMKIEDKKATIKRFGKYKSTLIMDTEIKTIAKYPNPAGFMILGISSVELNKNLDAKGGSLQISYDIDVDDVHLCRANLNINVKILDN
ncbi:MAG: DUF1934 domain-containing protein [Oscillospiraceae bacterium]